MKIWNNSFDLTQLWTKFDVIVIVVSLTFQFSLLCFPICLSMSTLLSSFCLSSPIFNSTKKKWSLPFYGLFKQGDRWIYDIESSKKLSVHTQKHASNKFSFKPHSHCRQSKSKWKGKQKQPTDDNSWCYVLYIHFMSSLSFRCDKNRSHFYLYRRRFNKIN